MIPERSCKNEGLEDRERVMRSENLMKHSYTLFLWQVTVESCAYRGHSARPALRAQSCFAVPFMAQNTSGGGHVLYLNDKTVLGVKA